MSILQGYVPLFVNATGGSTVYGAFDPINEIADICEKYNLWLHVDVSASRGILIVIAVAIATLVILSLLAYLFVMVLSCLLREHGVVDSSCQGSIAISLMESSGRYMRTNRWPCVIT